MASGWALFPVGSQGIFPDYLLPVIGFAGRQFQLFDTADVESLIGTGRKPLIKQTYAPQQIDRRMPGHQFIQLSERRFGSGKFQIIYLIQPRDQQRPTGRTGIDHGILRQHPAPRQHEYQASQYTLNQKFLYRYHQRLRAFGKCFARQRYGYSAGVMCCLSIVRTSLPSSLTAIIQILS